jgi:hypothetical protein
MTSIINVLAPQLSSANLFQAFADMIKLTPALHRDLEAAKVGLKWVGVVLEEPDVDYSIVVFQCYELPQDIFDGVFNTAGGEHRRARFRQHRRPLDLRTERAMDFDSNAPDSPASSTEDTTVWPDYGLNPGGFLTVRVQNRELAKTQLIAELVWTATQMLALSGAAVSGDTLDTTIQSKVFIDWDMVNFFDLTQRA